MAALHTGRDGRHGAGRRETARPISRIQRSILQILAARGSRLLLVDLVCELRHGSASAAAACDELGDLVIRQLVRELEFSSYELTREGQWALRFVGERRGRVSLR